MKVGTLILTLVWLLGASAVLAEGDTYSTQINITGKESGPYSIGAHVQPKGGKRPYKMDPSKNITNEDLSRILEPMIPFSSHPMDRQMNQEDLKNSFDQMDNTPATSSVGSHPATTAPIQDIVEEIEPDQVEKAELNDDHYHQLDLAIQGARKDLIDAEDSLAKATNEQDRQYAIGRIENARQRLQQATNAQ